MLLFVRMTPLLDLAKTYDGMHDLGLQCAQICGVGDGCVRAFLGFPGRLVELAVWRHRQLSLPGALPVLPGRRRARCAEQPVGVMGHMFTIKA
jgi:hypothetical protein